MANKIYKIVDGQYFEGDLYTVTDAANNKKKIVFDPSNVVTQGTLMDAEKFNQFQKNGTFYVNATHSIDGGNSVYTIEDFEDVGAFGLFNGFKLMVDPPNSCVAGAVISFLGSRYAVKKVSEGNLVNLSANDISKGLPFTVVYDNGMFKIQNISYDNKLDKGTGLIAANAKELETKIETLEAIPKRETILMYAPHTLVTGFVKVDPLVKRITAKENSSSIVADVTEVTYTREEWKTRRQVKESYLRLDTNDYLIYDGAASGDPKDNSLMIVMEY